MEKKILNYQTKATDIDSKQGIVTVAVNGIGIEDSQGDISMPGSFVNTLQKDFGRARWFLNHDLTQLLGVPLHGEEKADNLYITGKLNLQKQIARDILTDYELYNEAGRTLEHSIGVRAMRRDKADPRKVLEWKLFEYSTLTSWGANPNTFLVESKSATEQQARRAVEFLQLAAKKSGYSDDRYKAIETELGALLKALEGAHMVTCPYCGNIFDYNAQEVHTFSSQVLEAAGDYTRWIAEDVVRERINTMEPAIRAQVTEVLDAANATKADIAALAEYARCPHCYARVYKSMLTIAQGEEETTDTDTAEEPASKGDLFINALKLIF